MVRERAEEYLGAIYRLRRDAASPVPLSRLSEYFGFSTVSIHEMVVKLVDRGWIDYHPYHGVKLTESGTEVARALLRRHRLWERFLIDRLHIPWDEAHEIAGRLEHAAPELVTERLAELLGDPEQCPHGAPIPPASKSHQDECLAGLPEGAEGRVSRISPESVELLRQVQTWGIMPGARVRVQAQSPAEMLVEVDGRKVQVPTTDARAVWMEVF
jgi:DtxR family Mn-dependent transcriptional regulator